MPDHKANLETLLQTFTELTAKYEELKRKDVVFERLKEIYIQLKKITAEIDALEKGL